MMAHTQWENMLTDYFSSSDRAFLVLIDRVVCLLGIVFAVWVTTFAIERIFAPLA
jgi:uncharacterized membrane protein